VIHRAVTPGMFVSLSSDPNPGFAQFQYHDHRQAAKLATLVVLPGWDPPLSPKYLEFKKPPTLFRVSQQTSLTPIPLPHCSPLQTWADTDIPAPGSAMPPRIVYVRVSLHCIAAERCGLPVLPTLRPHLLFPSIFIFVYLWAIETHCLRAVWPERKR
jgi:hypothetical protein